MGSGGGTTVLWRPTGPEELDLVRLSGWRRWPQWVPAEEMDEFNDHIVGSIEVVHELR
ncbi:hypothetical protein [Micromonospora sp. CA-111912]|uniref:hypothetical protein n=1 Tax=Micromonospora sp. CA-111912 TaxID=3239955 RepID=UPI003D8D8D7E